MFFHRRQFRQMTIEELSHYDQEKIFFEVEGRQEEGRLEYRRDPDRFIILFVAGLGDVLEAELELTPAMIESAVLADGVLRLVSR